MNHRRTPVALTLPLAVVLGLTACSGGQPSTDTATAPAPDTAAATAEGTTGSPAEGDGQLTLYSGRNEELVQPILDRFTEETGIEVDVRYGDTAGMAAQLLEEGDRSPAEVFLAQDAGALGAVSRAGLLEALPQETVDAVPESYRSADGDWVGLTGRSRVLVYNPEQVSEDELPQSVDELVSEEWRGRVGVAPTNASFQSFITAMRVMEGDEAARAWLEDLAANDPQIREKNGHIVADVDSGAIDAGLVNHYYVHELAQEKGVDPEDLSVRMHFFGAQDTGALVNVSGAGLVGDQPDGDAQALIDYLLSEEGQAYFVEETNEYAMIEGAEAPQGVPSLEELEAPKVDLNDLDDLEQTIEMITQAGLL
ncbi:iron ABC transporter substrate-binding protein [Citricoccus sp.]|uniref:iron ABC transporter substrate-binding protein n=1 Tax=Citricoccus sp. TaxID=1978372 RepID=UPI002C04947F|nr:iron ABC transporter substrate-binding protein [Citricoccus sp.]HRO94424.1 iron ABC transporter substrate-binding protein [Citricoccus sp.]